MFDAIVSTCMRHGFSPRLFAARQMHTIVSLVSGGLGVALVPACVQALHREGVVYRPLLGERTAVETVAVWRRADDSPLVRALRALLPRPAAKKAGWPHSVHATCFKGFPLSLPSSLAMHGRLCVEGK